MVSLLITSFLIENKVYNEDASIQEIEAIKSRVYQLEEGIIVFDELPIMSEFTVNTTFDKLEELLEGQAQQSILFNLSPVVGIPTMEVRQLLYLRFARVSPKVIVYSFATGKNPILTIALKFFMNSSNAPASKSIFSGPFENALNKIYAKIR